jgi:hypothetical protein
MYIHDRCAPFQNFVIADPFSYPTATATATGTTLGDKCRLISFCSVFSSLENDIYFVFDVEAKFSVFVLHCTVQIYLNIHISI